MLGQIARQAARTRHASLQLQQLRFLNIHEYQGAELMSKFGVNVPPGKPAFSMEDVKLASEAMADPDGEVVIKSQILAGGRGLGKFKNGLQGGVHIVDKVKALELAKQMLGETLVTKQTGPTGKPVNTLYIAAKMKLINEMYFAILLDRTTSGVLLIGCSEGGTSIEDLAEKYPEKIIRIPVDIRDGITDAQANEMVDGLKIKSDDKKAAAEQIKALYNTFKASDCTMVEVNPLAEDADGKLIAADAKLGFDDNAAFRQKDIFALRDSSQEDPREVAAGKWDLNYIGLDGEIGCMVNGAGLAMATMVCPPSQRPKPAIFISDCTPCL